MLATATCPEFVYRFRTDSRRLEATPVSCRVGRELLALVTAYGMPARPAQRAM
jgi:hypothetical protein